MIAAVQEQEAGNRGRQSAPVGPKYNVLHRTTFQYGAPVQDSINSLHLEPRTFPFQKTLMSTVRVLPATRLQKYSDLFENTTHYFEIHRPHERLEIESRFRIVNLPLEIPGEAREACMDYYEDSEVRETTWAYLQDSRYVSKHPEIWRQAIDLTEDLPKVFDRASRIMEWVHDHFTYEAGSTHVSTHLEEAFAGRRGVCQDFTHVMIGLCRAIDLPARYASGYLYNGPRDKLVGAQASHAWPEIYLPEVGWVGFDPTNNCLADERFIKVAVGRDYDDVAPIKGTYHGTAQCRLSVTVEVEKI
ncbi:transglutaminase-like putative cysteine protease [Haloferula luteola]|uniref:Transglutaminase-like putative cysteine protease n=1 Tax=Haloferula luteola TaxID=595692 RepID=A0A840V2Z3_9BACT|nr:transglutaminase family protein [Haloferula luteola]MBB5352667.1 transglutaminase-like putative cysteine protease [Haloferula luteola]